MNDDQRMDTPITVISSYTHDAILSEQLERLEEHEAGPAFFISTALQNEAATFELIHGDLIQVEILITPKGEFGRIPIRPLTKPITDRLSDWTIISTVLNEWDITPLTQWPTHLFVDLQGFIRSGEDFGTKKVWNDILGYSDKIFCLKGTKEEVSHLPASVRESQKQRLLVATDGDKGVDLFYKGTHTFLPTPRVSAPKDTIGAGDTYLSYFVVSMQRGNKPVIAATYASTKTAAFLEQKKVASNQA